jgi:hypothetical protein
VFSFLYTLLYNGSNRSCQPNMTHLINRSNELCRVNPLFNWVVLRSKGLTFLVKRVVSKLTLNRLTRTQHITHFASPGQQPFKVKENLLPYLYMKVSILFSLFPINLTRKSSMSKTCLLFEKLTACW